MSTKFFLSLLAAAVSAALLSEPAAARQIQGLPNVSPKARVEQVVGISTVAVDYHRPAVNGRTILGGLVPLDQVWRAGANDNTTIAFGDPVTVEGKSLDAGTYGLHMIPSATNWIVAFSNNSTSWGSFSYDPAEDALRVEVKARTAPFSEQLSYQFEDVTTDAATLVLRWADLAVPIKLGFDTKGLVVAKIRRDLRHTAGFSPQGFISAANWALANDVATEEALGWADRAIAIGGPVQARIARAGLLEKMGREAEGKAELEAVATTGTEVDVNALGYFYLYQKQDPKKAVEVFAKNSAAHPESWNTYDSLAEATGVLGNKAEAIRLFERARSLAPEAQHARIDQAIAALR